MKENWREFLSLFIVVGTTLFLFTNGTPPKGNEMGVVMELPEKIEDYDGATIEVSDAELEILPPDTEFAKMQYSYNGINYDPHRVQFTIVLSGESRTSIHKPEICMQGQGWNLNERKVIPVDVKGKKLEVMAVSVEKDQPLEEGGFVAMNGLYLYWFIGHDSSTPYNSRRMWLTAKQNIVENINPRWAYASAFIAVPKEHEKLSSELEGILSEFVVKIAPECQKEFMPSHNE